MAQAEQVGQTSAAPGGSQDTTARQPDPIRAGDAVEEDGQSGLKKMVGPRFVLEVVGMELRLSETPGGEPMTDALGKPRLFPARKFRKISVG